ncbi:rod shape-determining protein MreD [Microbacter margulisiae]|uniref:Rod shape-determining protein MreD n=1 Tax=Microbacter margulisiae TaxID=1350067 RepID=A0A7W5DNU3_9PORP|nr:rod shape-determining protein MreD [Microbacter margulisiae]MBB3185874.1 rod shape-determining protein MreD [Microbacter margulisiae]
MKHLIRFVILMLLQVLIFDNIRFLGYVNPLFYIWFILGLPSNINRSALLIIAFLTGSILDIFSNTPGMYAFATVFVAYMRAPVLKVVVPRDNTLAFYEPSVKILGLPVYVKYAAFLIVLLHLLLFSLEAFTFVHYEMVLIKTVINASLTLLFVLSVQKSKI